MVDAVWVIAHGSKNQSWVEKMDHMARKVKYDVPLLLSFLENVKDRDIEDGVLTLKGMLAKKVLVVPVFVSTASNHITEIKEGLSNYKELDFIYTNAMDDHRYVVDHIIQAAKELMSEETKHVKKQALLLLAHGSVEVARQGEWSQMLSNIKKQIKDKSNIKEVQYATFYPNDIERVLEGLVDEYDITVVPLFLSSGYFTEVKIPKVINKFKVRYNGKAYLDGDWISEWVDDQIKVFQMNKKDISLVHGKLRS